MNDETDTPTDVAETPRRQPSRLFRSANKVKLAPDQAKRQGEITTLAFLSLGSAGAISLLNQPHADLGARPLDLAIASEEGFATVEQLIRTLAKQNPASS